ncbi:MAG: DUF3857 domain-containing protein [Lentisphaeraceae bacterium]|nr:DUF3857 domain-containing protein [Lentisphaeraceae bacterium]
MFAYIIALICLVKAAKSFNDPKHNKFCSIIFIVFCFVWLLSKAGGQLLTNYIPYDINIISLYLVLLMITYGICFTLGVAAIAKFNNKVHDSGKSQAAAVIILSLIFGSVQYFQYNKIQQDLSSIIDKSEEQIAIVSEENNYSFILPEETEYKLLKQVNEMMKEADFILKHDSNKFFFMLVSQKIGVDSDVDSKAFYDAVLENQKTAYKSFKDIEHKTTLINGIPAQDHLYSIKIGKQRFLYHTYALVHNGMYFQLTTYTLDSINEKLLKQHSKKLSKFFKILDKDKKYYSHDIKKLNSFTSTISPYEIDFSKNDKWFVWEDFATECPESEFGGRTIDQDVSFCTTALEVDTSKYSHEELANAMLRDFDMRLDDKDVTFVKKNAGTPFESYTVKAAREIDSENYEYFFNIYFAQKSAFRLVTWGLKDNEFTKQASDDLLKHLKLSETEAIPAKPLPEKLKLKQAELWNYLGLILNNTKKYEESCECYLKAIDFDNNKTVAVTNYFLALVSLEQHEKIIEFLDQRQSLLADPNILGWLAFSQKQVGLYDAAMDNYFLLFSENKNYLNDEDFIDYIGILSSREKFDVISEICSMYLKSDREQKLFHDLINLLMNNEQLVQAKQQLDSLPAKYKNTLETKRLQLRYFIAAGDFKTADKSFQSLLEEGYRDKTTLYTGAELYYDIGWYSKAKTALLELLKIAPNDEKSKELMELTLSYLGEGEKGNTVEEIQAVALPQAVLDKISSSQKSEVSGDIKYDYHITSYSYKNNRLKKTIYRKFILNTAKGVKDNSTLYYTHSPTSSSLYVNTLTVTSPDGVSQTVSDRNAFYLTEADDDQASEDKTLCMPVSALEPGCTVEYTLTENYFGNYDFFPFKRHWLTMTVPYDLDCVTVTGDIEKISYVLKNAGPKVIRDQENLIFIQTNKIIYKSEPEAVDAENVYPILYLGNNTENWQKEIKSYQEKIKKKLAPSPELESLVRSITKNAQTVEDKVRLLTYYIQDNITYKAIEFGSRGIIPDLPEKILKQKYGDCKDMSVLLHQMLKTLNIKSTLTFVSTDYKLIKEIADIDQFNHMILYVNDLNAFIDCTIKYADLLSIGNVYNYDKEVLLIDSNKTSIMKVPYQTSTENTFQVDRVISINPDKSLEVKEKIIVKDYYAFFIRRELKSKDEKEKKDRLQRFVNSWPDIRNFKGTFKDLDDKQKELTLEFTYTVDNAIKTLNDEITVNLVSPWLIYYFTVQESTERYSPFNIYYNVKLDSKTTLKLNKNSSLTFNRVKYQFDKIFAKGEVSAVEENNTLQIEVKAHLKKGTFEAGKYSDYYNSFKEFINTANIHFKISE